MKPATVVWRFRDGKAGHERQTAGLLSALATQRPITVIEINAREFPRAWWAWLRGIWPGRPGLALPDLVVGAGSACAWPMLAAARAFGARSVYLMNPSLPRGLFDLCLVPRHDGVPASARVMLTEGVLNDLVPLPGPRSGATLVLVGGPSRHHVWDEAGLLGQIDRLHDSLGETSLVISDSRRTPPSTTAQLVQRVGDGVHFVSHTTCGPDWLREALMRAPAAWVTADSVSMLFEALSAGCAVGVLEVPARRADRITRIASTLLAESRVLSLAQWQASGEWPPHPPLAEAARCAVRVAAELAH